MASRIVRPCESWSNGAGNPAGRIDYGNVDGGIGNSTPLWRPAGPTKLPFRQVGKQLVNFILECSVGRIAEKLLLIVLN